MATSFMLKSGTNVTITGDTATGEVTISSTAPTGTGTTDAGQLTGTLSPARIADGSLTIAKTLGLQGSLDGKVANTSVGVPNGVASLDSNARNPWSQAQVGAVCTIVQTGAGAWPSPPSTRTDLVYLWISRPGDTTAPPGVAGAINLYDARSAA